MTREEAIETIKTAIAEVEWEYPMNYAAAFEVAIKALKEQARWIPVSERLPEKNGEYLITGRQGAVNKRRYHDGHWYGNWSVLAWMPLPQPYKAESEVKENE